MSVFKYAGRQKRFSMENAKDIPGVTYRGFLSQLTNEHQERLKRIQLFWDFYEGMQWDGSTEGNLYAGGDERPTINYCKRLVDTRGQFLMKNSLSFSIPESSTDDQNTKEARAFIKEKLDQQWALNDVDIWVHDCVQTGGVTGDVFIRVNWEESTPFAPGYAKAEILPSNWVFFDYDTIQRNKVNSVTIAFPFEDTEHRKSGVFNKVVEEHKVTRIYQEVWTTETVTYLIDGEIQSVDMNGLGVIPVVHIKNMPNSNGNFGTSDLHAVLNVQRLLNEKITDLSDIIQYHGSPQTFVLGADASKLKRGHDEIWSVSDVNVKIGNLERKGDLKANLEFISNLRQYMLDLSAIPEQAINPTKNVSNTPGVALHMSYLPMIETRKVQVALYGAGIKQISSLMLLMNSFRDPEFGAKFLPLPGYSKYTVDVGFGEALPRDESLKLSNDQQRMAMGLASRKQVLIEQGYGENDAERIIKESDDDTVVRTEVLTANEPTADAFGKQRMPDPVVQGDKVSTEAGKG